MEPTTAAPGHGTPSSPPPAAWWPGGPTGPNDPTAGPGAPPGAYPGWVPQQPRTEGLANGALVAGIVSLLCGFLGVASVAIGPLAVLLGVFARRRINGSGGTLTGQSRATAGIVLGLVGAVFSIGWLVLFLANPDIVQDFIDQLSTTTTTSAD